MPERVLRRRELGAALRREDGIAVVISIQLVVILTLLLAAVLGSTLSLGDTTQRDLASKRALAGAMSGLEVARYRINKISPGNSMCVTDRAVPPGTPPAPPGQCPAYAGDLGNGTTFGYRVTPALPNGSTCGGQQSAPGSPNTSRCVTAYGTSDGVTRRVQALVSKGPASTALFPINGIIGLDSISLNETGWGDINGEMASNGSLTIKSCKITPGAIATWRPGPGATASVDAACSDGFTQQPPTATAWTLSSLAPFYTGTESTNDNLTVFGSAVGFQYTSSSRTLKDTADATLILNGANPRAGSGGIWTFNLCSLTFTHKTQIKLQNGAVARFLIDSNQRTGSGCGAGASLTMTNVSAMNFDAATGVPGNPAHLQFFYYGTGQVSISNQSGFSAAFYAPDGDIKFTNKTKWVGAIAAKNVTTTNGLDFTAGDVSSITGGSTTTRYNRAVPGFVECTASPTNPNDPTSGC